MSGLGKRIETLKALLTGTVVARDPAYTTILGELSQVDSASKIAQRDRKLLLQVLHSTRALDSTLAAFIRHRGVQPPPGRTVRSLGGYLWLLSHHTTRGIRRLSGSSRSRFRTSIVQPRNKFMHEAGAYPRTDREISVLLGEMQTCMIEVLLL